MRKQEKKEKQEKKKRLQTGNIFWLSRHGRLLPFFRFLLFFPIGFSLWGRPAEGNKEISLRDYMNTVEPYLIGLEGKALEREKIALGIKAAKAGSDLQLTSSLEWNNNRLYSPVKSYENDLSVLVGLGGVLFPTATKLGGSIGYNHNFREKERNFLPEDGLGKFSTVYAGFSLTQPLLYNAFGSLDRLKLRKAENDLRTSQLEEAENRRELLSRYEELYYRWSLWRKENDLIREQVEKTLKSYREIRKKKEAGLVDDDAVEQVYGALLGYRINRETGEQKLEALEGELSSFLDTNFYRPEESLFERFYRESLKSAWKKNSFRETKRREIFESRLESLSLREKAAKAAMLPRLDLKGELRFKSGFENREDFKDHWDTDFNLGLRLNFPLEGRVSRLNRDSAVLDAELTANKRDEARQNYEVEQKRLFSVRKALKANIRLTEKSLEARKRLYRALEKKFNQARSDLQSLLNTEVGIVAAELSLLELKYEVIRGELRYRLSFR